MEAPSRPPMNIEALVTHIEYLVIQDETDLALKCLDMVPAYYRDHRDGKLESLRHEILSKVLTSRDMTTDWREMPKTVEHCVNYLNGTSRGQVLKNELEAANKLDIKPTIVEFGPGDFCFPIALHHLDLKFNYLPLTLHNKAEEAIIKIMPDKVVNKAQIGHTWFVAYEIIEHLWNTDEIRMMHDRHCPLADKIFLSTPKYTYAQGTPQWREDGIHHLRAYTPLEFVAEGYRLFWGKKWNFYEDKLGSSLTLVSA